MQYKYTYRAHNSIISIQYIKWVILCESFAVPLNETLPCVIWLLQFLPKNVNIHIQTTSFVWCHRDMTCWQIRVVVRDGGTPQLQDTAVVNINVNRNLKAPRFEQTDYRPSIRETQDLGVAFQRVLARDDDTKVHNTPNYHWTSYTYFIHKRKASNSEHDREIHRPDGVFYLRCANDLPIQIHLYFVLAFHT